MNPRANCWRAWLLYMSLFLSLVAAAPVAQASCVSGSESMDSADTAFEGVAMSGPITPDGALLSPARFEVTRWVKGDGPAEVEVPTAVQQAREGGMLKVFSVGIVPSPGERWLVMLRGGSPICTGSRLLAQGEEVPASESSSVRVIGGLVALSVIAGAGWAFRKRGLHSVWRRASRGSR